MVSMGKTMKEYLKDKYGKTERFSELDNYDSIYTPYIMCPCKRTDSNSGRLNPTYMKVELSEMQVLEEDTPPASLSIENPNLGFSIETHVKALGMVGQCDLCRTVYYIDYENRYISRDIPY